MRDAAAPAHATLPTREAPVIATPDVCVVGGGAAGVAAAVGAARLGLRVLLVEKYGFCGGATVAGLSGTICGLYSSGERPEQIVFGFAEEFHAALRAGGGAHPPVAFGRTLLVPHDSFCWKEAADSLLTDTHVNVLFHALFLDAEADERGGVATLFFQCAEGPVAVRPACVVDASGDAHVVHALRGASQMGRDGVVQAPTMIFRMGGVDLDRFLRVDPREVEALAAAAHRSGRYRLPRHHVYLFPRPGRAEVLCNMTRITRPDGTVPVGTRSDDLTFAEIEGRRQVRAYERFLRENVAGFERAHLVETGAQVGIRQTRSIVGLARLANRDVLEARSAPGAATFSAWPIEEHGADGVRIVYLEDRTYDIPFEALVPAAGHNILVAGRCLAAEHEALASARVTAQCFGMGYAVGAACGLLRRERLTAQQLTGVAVADWMKAHGLKRAWER